ncbi:hypothetical protein MQE36_11505 [Zhouia spongiae]|uniref:DUF4837 family protein n=1 Tax=Zhouia spongiae TaxID=2202721 RepID=A0ABY3YIM0_9FLAO|nr:hypothetical protein [Zhouia spongiae]UNY97709.1 hypothetical protein MQE36_11505 [Zhouia spongiae]
MINGKLQFAIIAICLVLFSCGISQEQAKEGLANFLQQKHQGKYHIKTFKKESEQLRMRADMFWVELELVENPKVIISFQWDAKKEELYTPNGKKQVSSVARIAERKLSEEKIIADLKTVLGNDVAGVGIDRTFINLQFGQEPGRDMIDSLSGKIRKVLEKYPGSWITEARVNICTPKDKSGFLQLIVKPKSFDETQLKERFKPNAILVNAFGSERASDVTKQIYKALEERTRSRQVLKMWVNQQNFDDLYVAVEVEKQHPRASKNLPAAYGVYLAKWNFRDFKVDKLRFFNYASVSKQDIVQFLEGKLPESYQVRTYVN